MKRLGAWLCCSKFYWFNTEDEEKASLIEEKAKELLSAVPGAHNVTFRRGMLHGDVRFGISREGCCYIER